MDAFLHTDLWLPAQFLFRFANIGVEDALVAGTPVAARYLNGISQQSLEHRTKLRPHRHDILRSAAHVVDLARGNIDLFNRGVIGIQKVIYVQDVAHLLAIAIDRDGTTRHGSDDKPCHPALVLDAELTRSINAALAQHHRTQSINTRVIAHVL